jgi:hypothetical protein
MTWRSVLASTVVVGTVLGACHRPGVSPGSETREVAAEGVESFRAFALDPARLPPPSLETRAEVEAGALRARAELVQPEQASWNQGPDGPVLFNDRWAWLVKVHVESTEGKPISWVADQTTLELNDPDTVLVAARQPDDLLGDLLFWALQEERNGLPGDLVARTRTAGGFRTAYLPRTGSAGVLDGLIAFPAADVEGLHVVAARLKVPIVHDGATVPVVWVFQ